jgi:hypothetical protein
MAPAINSDDYASTTFSITISMNQRQITTGSNIIGISYSITGYGNLSKGVFEVTSDNKNLIDNTFKLSGVYYQINESGDLERFIAPKYNGNGEGTSTYVTIAFFNSGYDEGIYGDFIFLNGEGYINTTGQQPGTYRIKTILIAETGSTPLIFQDSVEYEIIDAQEYFFQTNPLVLPIFGAGIAIISSVIASFITAKLLKETQSKTKK